MALAMDTETAGLDPGDAVYVIALHDPRCSSHCAVFDIDRHPGKHVPLAVDAMAKWAGEVCSFNGTKFDFHMLAAATDDVFVKRQCATLALEHTDIMLQFAAAKGYYASLESFARATLGHGKIGTGAAVVDDWALGKYDEIREYCADDAKLTSELHEYGSAYGRLKRVTKSGKTQIWALSRAKWLPAWLAIDSTSQVDVSWMDNPPDIAAAADWAVDTLAK